jgi:hypothetical protein
VRSGIRTRHDIGLPCGRAHRRSAPGGRVPRIVASQARKVSLQVPTYAEPPELVIATLDAVGPHLRLSELSKVLVHRQQQHTGSGVTFLLRDRMGAPLHLRLGIRGFASFTSTRGPVAKAGALNFASHRSPRMTRK